MIKCVELTAKNLIKEVGNWYGSYREENGKIILNNYERDFIYNTPEEGLIDWLDTMLDSNEEEDVETWSKEEIAFVQALGGKHG